MDHTAHIGRNALLRVLLLLSAMGALGLFMLPSTLVTLILLSILALLIFHNLVFLREPVKKAEFRPGACLLALTFGAVGFSLFPGNMAYTARMTGMAEALHLPYLTNARMLAGGLALLGLPAFYALASRMEEILCSLLALPLHREDPMPLSNLIFPLSALGFFLLEPQWNSETAVSAAAAVALALTIAIHAPALLQSALQVRPLGILAVFLSSLGILLFRTIQADRGLFGIAAAVLALPFVQICLTAFFCWLLSEAKSMHTFEGLKKPEILLYLCIFLAAVLFSAFVFWRTNAFYGTDLEFDLIYTADSPKLVQENAYLSLRHPENDLRQPLFAVLAAPFLGLPWLAGQILPEKAVMVPLLMNMAQIGLLLLSNFLLTRILALDSRHRMLFMGFSSLTYPVLLFTLTMEQYIVVYFYLILALYLLSRKQSGRELSFCAAGGTLLTSLILMPALGDSNPIKAFKTWYLRMLTLALSFVLALLFFGRLDIILNFPDQLLFMLQFSGQKLTALQKLHQYSGFFSQCLFSPPAGIDLLTMGHPSWQQLIPTGFSLPGLTVLALCIVSAVLNRKEFAARASGLWLGFSFLILFLLGWGTSENGLTLYTLYFGWPVWVLLFELYQKLSRKIPHGALILGLPALIFLAAFSLPGILKVLSFACQYYPI